MRDPILEPPSMKVYICTIRANPLDTYGTDTIAEIHTDYESAMKWLDYHSAESDRSSKVERRGNETTVFKKIDAFKYGHVTYRVHIHDIYGVIPYEPDSQAL